MMVTWVHGFFKDIHGTLALDWDHPLGAGFSGEIDARKLWTGEADRDTHLRSADFFDTANFPVASFQTLAIRHLHDDRYEIDGDLTIRGVTRPVTLSAELSEFILDPWGNRRAAVTVEGEINRTDFGLTWNQVLEAGRLMVGEKVKISATTEVALAVAAAA
jgi:polyisoprenoid-binding protein YceI